MSLELHAVHTIVIDWGIGGFGAWRRLHAAQQGGTLSYVSDAGFTPWGKVAPEVLATRLVTLVQAVMAEVPRKHARLVVACNAMSTVLEGDGEGVWRAGPETLPLPAWGIISAGVRVALASGASRVGVIGGARTIAAGLHADALRAAGREVVAVVAQPLSAHVEAGRLDGEAVSEDVSRVVAEVTAEGPVDALLLACTHYPALAPVFERLMPGVPLCDPLDGLTLQLTSQTLGAPADLRFFTTGDPDAMRQAAHQAFGVTIANAIAVMTR